MVFGVSPVKVMEWAVTKAPSVELRFRMFESVPKSTLESEASSVSQVMVTVPSGLTAAAMFEMTGPVVSSE